MACSERIVSLISLRGVDGEMNLIFLRFPGELNTRIKHRKHGRRPPLVAGEHVTLMYCWHWEENHDAILRASVSKTNPCARVCYGSTRGTAVNTSEGRLSRLIAALSRQ